MIDSSEFEFRCLNERDEKAHHAFVDEFLKANEEVIPSAAYKENLTFPEWLSRSRNISIGKSLPENYVPATTYFLIRKGDGKILGALDIRHELNDHLLKFSGHIGYGVAPSERRKGYASLMLSEGLIICKKMGIQKVLITCNKNNIGSARTIQKNGGVLENEVEYDGVIRQRYWIKIK